MCVPAAQAQKAFGTPLGKLWRPGPRYPAPKVPWEMRSPPLVLAKTQFSGERTGTPEPPFRSPWYLLASSKPIRPARGTYRRGLVRIYDDEQRDRFQGELNGIFDETKPSLWM